MVKKALWVLFLTVLILLFLGGFRCGYYIRKNYFQPIVQDQGKTNFLILGINGSEALDSDLTDTIIFASLNSQTRKAALLSLPRDIWIEEMKAKINTAYHYGGFALARQTLEALLGETIDYILVVDFEGFKKAIDVLGGVSVEVKEGFDDYWYPIAGKEKDNCDGDPQYRCRYEHLRFEAGQQLMDGERALKFVRSRNAEGDQGTDFSRVERQQALLGAVKDRILSKEVYLRPEKIRQLLAVFEEATITEISPQEYGQFLLLGLKINWQEIKTASLNEDNFLFHPKNHSSGQWVLVPKSENWKEVQEFVQKLIR